MTFECMMKSGAGNPPIHYKRRAFIGDIPIGPWEDA